MTTRLPCRGGAALAGAVETLYRAGQTDYMLDPMVVVDGIGQPIGRIRDGDTVIFCCRRGEREVQLTEAFTDPSFGGFSRPPLRGLQFVTLTLYHEKFRDLAVAFAPSRVADPLGEIVSRAGLRQLRVAESEKFAHVTFFLNGGSNQPFAGEEDVSVPSPKGISPDRAPALSLKPVSEQISLGIDRGYDLIVANFANGDVVGHTHSRPAKIRCAEHIDSQLGAVASAAQAAGVVLMITADHGNLELMSKADGTPHVAHTTNPVPFLLIDPLANGAIKLRGGRLADVAPTVLAAMGLERPEAMESAGLAPEHDWHGPRRVLLLILDGWGIGRQDDSNPIFLGRTPVWDGLTQRFPLVHLQASGKSVGLQADRAGNSEAGHMNLGAGRVVLQDDMRLDLAMRDGSFESNATLVAAIQGVKHRNASLHLLALLSHQSSHGTTDYPLALLRMAKAAGLAQVYVHIVFDGRSSEPGSAPALLAEFEEQINKIGVGDLVSGVGRGLALDRDGNYDRTRRAYEALVLGAGLSVAIGEREQS